MFEFDSIRIIYDIDTIELTREVDFMCSCIYGLVRSHTVLYGSHGLVRSLIRLYTDIAPVSVFKSFKNHTRLSRIHSDCPSVTRIRPRLVRLFIRFTRMANRISRVFCVRQALARVNNTLFYAAHSLIVRDLMNVKSVGNLKYVH